MKYTDYLIWAHTLNIVALFITFFSLFFSARAMTIHVKFIQNKKKKIKWKRKTYRWLVLLIRRMHSNYVGKPVLVPRAHLVLNLPILSYWCCCSHSVSKNFLVTVKDPLNSNLLLFSVLNSRWTDDGFVCCLYSVFVADLNLLSLIAHFG